MSLNGATRHGADDAAGSPAFTDMAFGRLLFGTGRLGDARAFLEQARPADEDEAIERLFLLGHIEMRLGLPRAAARRFQAILARRPDLTRARLELATAYYAAERDDKARYHFEQSLADPVQGFEKFGPSPRSLMGGRSVTGVAGNDDMER